MNECKNLFLNGRPDTLEWELLELHWPPKTCLNTIHTNQEQKWQAPLPTSSSAHILRFSHPQMPTSSNAHHILICPHFQMPTSSNTHIPKSTCFLSGHAQPLEYSVWQPELCSSPKCQLNFILMQRLSINNRLTIRRSPEQRWAGASVGVERPSEQRFPAGANKSDGSSEETSSLGENKTRCEDSKPASVTLYCSKVAT